MGRHRATSCSGTTSVAAAVPSLTRLQATERGGTTPAARRSGRGVAGRMAVTVVVGAGAATVMAPLMPDVRLPVASHADQATLNLALVATGPRASDSADQSRPAAVAAIIPADVDADRPRPSPELIALTKATRRSEQACASAPSSPASSARPAASRGAYVRPVTGRITSNFGPRWGTTHYGLDIANRIGTPIRSVASGTVIDAGPASGFGLWVRVRLDDGTITLYGHINRVLVSEGDRVAAGDVIAEVGNRGQSTGPHLHFETISPAGAKQDPLAWLERRGAGDVAS